MRTFLTPIAICSWILIASVTGCDSPQTTNVVDASPSTGEELVDPSITDATPDGGIAVPKNVRDNLGITFVEVERRNIAETRRLPGVFELRPDARHEYRALLQGRVTLSVNQFDTVEKGDLLFTINSPQWRQIQHDAVEAEGEIVMAEATRDVVQARLDEAKSLLEKTELRLNNLQEAGARNAQLEIEASALRSSVPRIVAELTAQEAAVDESHGHYLSRLRILSSVTGLSTDELTVEVDGIPTWQSIRELEILAESSGTVEQLNIADGGWLTEGELALSTINHHAVRFHAEAPQSDITLYKDGLKSRVVASQGASVDLQSTIPGTLQLGLTAHAEERTFSIYLTPEATLDWTRAGVSAFLEVTLTEDLREEWAIPLACVVQDGLDKIFYRRDPEDPNRVLRVLADLGEDDGRWVAVRSRVKAGDQIVLDGAYALKMSGQASQAPEGYHYHADGTLHKNH